MINNLDNNVRQNSICSGTKIITTIKIPRNKLSNVLPIENYEVVIKVTIHLIKGICTCSLFGSSIYK